MIMGLTISWILFLILINYAGFPNEVIAVNIGTEISKPKNKRKPIMKTRIKYIDDLSFAAAINLVS